MQARRDRLKQRQDAAHALPAPELGQNQLHLTAPSGVQVNGDRADQILNQAVAAENLQAAQIHRATFAAVDRDIPRAAPALNHADDAVPYGVDSDGDVDVPIQPDDDHDAEIQPDDHDYMPGVDDDLYPEIAFDETDTLVSWQQWMWHKPVRPVTASRPCTVCTARPTLVRA